MTPEQIETYVDAAAALLALPLSAEHRPGVVSYFTLAANLAEQVAMQPLGVHDDPAEAFMPISPNPSKAAA